MPLERRKPNHPTSDEERWIASGSSSGNDDGDSDRRNRSHRTWLALAFARGKLLGILLFCVGSVLYFNRELLRLDAEGSNDGTALALSAFKANDKSASEYNHNENQRDGFMVLGMHRSGTSMLTGLLFMAGGYTFGGKIHKAKANTKGFFERFDVVGQNDKFLKKQGVSWNKNVLAFDWEQALKDKESGVVEWKGGARAMRFFTDPQSFPWLQKDPRMCLTLRVWLALMEKEPAIVYTYRHPLEVALSLQKRNSMRLTTGLKLWIAYNMRAIQNSKGLCMVKTSNKALLADPMKELQRISDELTKKCSVRAPPHRIQQQEVEKFIDPNLQHQHADEEKEILATYNDGTCVAYNFESKMVNKTPEKIEKERETYLVAMRIYCDLESGKAYEDDYTWPEILGFDDN